MYPIRMRFLLGGGAGYPTKTLTYPYLGESAALDEVISVLSQIRAFKSTATTATEKSAYRPVP